MQPSQPLADHAQELVAGIVAEGVVDQLEAVEVEEEQRDRAGAVRAGECLIEPLHEHARGWAAR